MIFNYTGIDGFDVSFYQDNNATPHGIDFAKMKQWGAEFVIIRAGQKDWIDSDFAIGWKNAKAAGLPRGAYWFYDPRETPERQAKLFTDLVRNDPPEGRLWIDLEYPETWGGTYKHWTDWRRMIEEVKRLSGLRVGIYTGNWWWANRVIADPAYFGQYPLWVAQYTSMAEDVTLPRGWSSALIWQDGTPSIGAEVGVESKEIDHNKFNGTAEDFAREFGNDLTPSPTPSPSPLENQNGEGGAMTATTLAQVKIFDKANGKQIGLIAKGITFNVSSRNGYWLARTAGGYVNVLKNGTQAVMVRTAMPTPPVTVMPSDLIQVNFDYDQQWTADNGSQYHVSRPTRNKAANRTESLPATANFRATKENVPMTEDIQNWIHTMNMQRNPSLTEAEGRAAFYSLFRDDAYATNFAGTTTRADYINGTNLNASLPMLIPMGCGGTVFKQIGSKMYNGEDCWIIETIDDSSNYRQYTPETHPHLFYTPSNSARRKIYKSVLGVMVWSGKWDERFSNPFHQYGSNPIMPLLTHNTSTALIPKWRCHTGAIQNYVRG